MTRYANLRDPAEALEKAKKAVARGGNTYLSTLGAAHFRAGDAKEAKKVLARSVARTNGGTGYDHYFLALACHELGDASGARQWRRRGDAWLAANRREDDLERLQEEVQRTLGTD